MAKISKSNRRLYAVALVLLVLGLVIYGLLKSEPVEPVELEVKEVRGDSLGNVLQSGDHVEVDFQYYDSNEVERGDIVLYNFAGNDAPLIKIVYGVPGDQFSLQKLSGGQRLIINGHAIKNSEGEEFEFNYARASLLAQYIVDYNGIIPGDAYFIFGDKKEGSLDSSKFGLISKEDILGKVIR